MDQYFRDALEGIKTAAQHMIASSQHLVAANEELRLGGEALTKAANGALQAKAEHEDLRETVRRLEGLVVDLVADVRRLREEKGGAE